MEVRLTASIKETRNKEMSDMEEWLSNIISTTINEAVKGIQSSLNTIVNNNLLIQTHSTEIVTLRNEKYSIEQMTSTINSGTIKNEKATSEDRNKKS